MLTWLLNFDNSLFLAINSLPHNSFLDTLGLFFSFLGAFGFVWFVLAILIYVLSGGRKKDYKFLISMGIAGFLSLFFVTFIFKPVIARERPMATLKELATVVRNNYFPEAIVDLFDFVDAYAFPSGHTTMAFAGAFVLAKKKPKFAWGFYLLAFLIAFSRIYLGRHFPLDVLGGIMLGTGIGWVSTLLGQSVSLKSKVQRAK